MNNTTHIQNPEAVNRLIALWALSEGFLGGILHLARFPLTGLVLSNVAVILVCLIAKFSDRKGAILKATLIVLVVKGILSPHTPLTAYIAVSLQGILGELFFYKRKFPVFSAIALGFIVSILTSFQKVIFLTVIFGQNFWISIDKFITIILKDFFGFTDSNVAASKWLVLIYISIHIIAGIIAGLYSTVLYKKTDSILQNDNRKILFDPGTLAEDKTGKVKKSSHKKWWQKPFGIFFFVLTLSLLAYSYFYPENPYIEKNSLIIMLVRGILLMFLWFKFASPLLTGAFKKFIDKRKNKYTTEIENVVNILPLFKSIINFCWKETSHEKGLKRLHRFFSLTLLNLLTLELVKK